MYDIRINYKTGNSFGRHDESDMVDLPVESLDIAKENLQRIKQHYLCVQDRDSYHPKSHTPAPLPDYVLDNGWSYSLALKTSELNERIIIHPFWCGYFETLHGAEIISIGDDELSFEL